MGVNKVEFGGKTLVDLTSDTVNEQNLLSGYTAHNKAGELIQGLAVIPTKLSQLENDAGYAKTESPAFTGIPTAPTPPDSTNSTQIATTAYVKKLIANLVNGAPETLDTLKEIADALGENDDAVQALNAAIGNKVDKVAGKGLSTNDFTTAEKNKLAGIATGANKTTYTNNLTATVTGTALDAVQGKVLNDKIDKIGANSSTNPTGTIISFMGTTAPNGYLICDGASYNIADYQYLAQHFTSNFGKSNYFGGDGISTFKVPDLRGEFLRGTGANGHANQGGGLAVGVHQDGTSFPWMGASGAALYIAKNTNIGNADYANGAGDYFMSAQSSSGDKIRTNFTSRPTNTSVLYCIKY